MSTSGDETQQDTCIEIASMFETTKYWDGNNMKQDNWNMCILLYNEAHEVTSFGTALLVSTNHQTSYIQNAISPKNVDGYQCQNREKKKTTSLYDLVKQIKCCSTCFATNLSNVWIYKHVIITFMVENKEIFYCFYNTLYRCLPASNWKCKILLVKNIAQLLYCSW